MPDLTQHFLDATSWYTTETLPDPLLQWAREKYDEMFALHPASRGEVVMQNETKLSPRWHKSFLHTPTWNEEYAHGSYMFGSKKSDISGDLPSLFMPFLDYLNDHSEHKYNQVVINWYADGADYTPQHADCEKGMLDNANIAVLTLGDSERDFRIRNKPREPFTETSISCSHGTIIKMCGAFQKNLRHGIPKCSKCKKSRISITFRQMHD